MADAHVDAAVALHRVAPEFLSFNIDAEALPAAAGFNWTSPRLARLAARLGPAYLRVGGSAQNRQKYDEAFFAYGWPSLLQQKRCMTELQSS